MWIVGTTPQKGGTMGPGMFDGLGDLFASIQRFIIVSLLVAWPLAAWKAFDIVWWFISHMRWEWQ